MDRAWARKNLIYRIEGRRSIQSAFLECDANIDFVFWNDSTHDTTKGVAKEERSHVGLYNYTARLTQGIRATRAENTKGISHVELGKLHSAELQTNIERLNG